MPTFKEYIGKIKSEKILNRSIAEVGGDIYIYGHLSFNTNLSFSYINALTKLLILKCLPGMKFIRYDN